MPCPATMRRRWKRDATAISPNRSARASFSPKCTNSWGDAEGSRPLRTPPRILVVDDNLTNLEVLRVRLNAHGYEVITAVDGEDALRRARELEPDLVLLDIMMPKLDGISVLKELKRDTALPFIPVILVTAKADTRDVVSGLEAGGIGRSRPFHASHQGASRYGATAGGAVEGANRATLELEPVA